MTADEKLIEWLRKISDHCAKCCGCKGCKFNLGHDSNEIHCQIRMLCIQMSAELPIAWNIEEIERIIKQ